jgi:glutamyl-Q tRNA(Asp) synthetase
MITRFAPSPTGPLHLGHAYSAILAHDMARAAGGTFLLRIEDIDQSRARPEWETLIHEDLRWLGPHWEEPVMRQSGRMAAYPTALDRLWAMGLLYPCTCTRRDIAQALSAPQEGAEPTDRPRRPRLSRHLPPCPGAARPGPDRAMRAAPRHGARRRRAVTGQPGFTETGAGPEGQPAEIDVSPDHAHARHRRRRPRPPRHGHLLPPLGRGR